MERSSKHLHNFNLPSGLTWGRQKLLKCMNINPVRPMPAFDDNESSDSGEDNNHPFVDNRRTEVEGFHRFPGERSSDDRRRRLVFKLNSVLEKNSPSLNSKSLPKSPPPPPKICSNAEAVDSRSDKKSTRPRRNVEKKEEIPKFSIALSRKEIEEDFIAMTGMKPPRKPKKQPKSIQMKLDAVFPGSWLSEVHPDRYKVSANGKI
ncbi:hypothetical protein L1987_12090 [Smallanthus sonchifolius]|uniref:Uncharacterized protein n=1 Tax=Smallanthus sonchifolius TaxID=185202 RepID=A0ACB9JDN8_9ASTR|nr:hypothetical protein L1987_12090 [Smallanthus sonchifolius]